MKNVIELVAKEKTYSGRELAGILGVGASTLRKWSMLLEQQGYWFLRDSQNRREYRQADIDALRSFYQLTKEHLMPLEEAARTVAGGTSFQQARKETAASLSLVPPVVPSAGSAALPANHSPALSASTSAALALRTSAHVDLLEEKIHSLAQQVQHQDAVQMALMERLEQQEAYIRSSLKERDRRLTKAMNDIIEAKQQLAQIRDEQRKKSIWHRLFRIQYDPTP
ncbi:MerR family transcriptional regulator [Brevibacillus borstelensis]|uniref:MerR family transcriptional regulator n=1 Tax=Brevibacillus borstelensis TaxID=45462 RepID=UPI0030C4E7E9